MPPLSSSKILQGSLTGIILKLLSEQERMYGYEMTRAVRTRTDGRLSITEAALYPALHKLVEEGLLETETEQVAGRERKYYRIARKEKKASENRVAALLETLAALQKLLHEPTFKPA